MPAIVQLHLAVLLFGLAGLMGKLVELPAMYLVLGRTLIGAAALAVIILLFRGGWQTIRINLPRSLDYLQFLLSGAVLTLHWWGFFYAIQLGGVGVALVGFSAFPIFVLLMENWRFQQSITMMQIVSTLMVVFGLWLVAPEISWHSEVTQGLVWGIISGLLFAILAMQNQYLVPILGGMNLGLWQQGIAALCCLPWLGFSDSSQPIGQQDMVYILVLGVLLTALPHTLFIHCLRYIKAHTAAIVTSLEPVYGIAFAWLLLAEIPAKTTLLGAFIILLAVILVQTVGLNKRALVES